MLLSSIVGKYPIKSIEGSKDIEIRGIEHNSKNVKKGNLFIAQKGYNHDGHDYILDAIENGAIALVIDKDIQINIENITIIHVENSADALGYFASRFYGNPWSKMHIIGITGTNGKTTTSYIIKEILERNNKRVGIIGTMGVVIDKEYINIVNTTPDALEIQKNLYKMVEKQIDYCIMEVSSHALMMGRVKYMDFDTSIFTNLSRDHLDFHINMENYYNSKLKLFKKTYEHIILNTDDMYGKRIQNDIDNKSKIITYGLKDRDIYSTDITYIHNKAKFLLNTSDNCIEIELKVPGEFNLYNSLAATACCYSLGLDISLIKEGLESFKGVKGRFEEIFTKQGRHIIIDFAHTPEGLIETLKTIKRFCKGRVITLFGAGGNRDKSKRPIMGEVAGLYSDFVIITSDNPRFEEPMTIAKEIEEGIKKTTTDYMVILDRKEAINYAIINSRFNDTILIAGKGHEMNMSIKGKDIPFDERAIIQEILKELD